MSDWQPIETAEWNKAVLVTFAPEDIPEGYMTMPGVMVAYRQEYYAEGGAGYDGGSGWTDASSGEECRLHYGEPTHWIPLPEPPRAAK